MNDLYPSSPFSQGPPPEQVLARKIELEKMAISVPVIEEFLADLESELAWAKDITNLEPGTGVQLESQVLAMKKYAAIIARTKDKFEANYKDFKEASNES